MRIFSSKRLFFFIAKPFFYPESIDEGRFYVIFVHLKPFKIIKYVLRNCRRICRSCPHR